MATTPNALDYLSKATNTPKVNLFDFDTIENIQRPNFQQPANQLQQPTQQPVQQNVIQDFLNQTKWNTEFIKKRKAVIEMLQNEEEDSFIEDSIINQMKFTWVEQKETAFSDNKTFFSRIEEKARELAETEWELDLSNKNMFQKLMWNTRLKAQAFSWLVEAGIWEAIETTWQIASALTPDVIEEPFKQEVLRQFEMVTGSDLSQAIGTSAKGIWYTAKEVFEMMPEPVQQELENLWVIGIWVLDAIWAWFVVKQTWKQVIKQSTKFWKEVIKPITEKVVTKTKWIKESIKLEWLAPEKAAAISTKANRFTSWQEAKFLKETGETSWEFATRRWMTKVWDEAVDESTKFFKQSIKEADDGFALINGKHIEKWNNFMATMLDDLDLRLTNTKAPNARKVSLLNKKYKEGGLSMLEINEVKRIYSRNFKYNFLESGWEAAQKSKNLQDWVRKWQFQVAKENWFKNIDKINKNTKAWRSYTDNLQQSMGRKGTSNEMSLTDWIILSGWEPTNLAWFVWKRTFGSPTVKWAIIKWLGKQTKSPIIKADRLTIAKTRAKKELSKTQLALPAGKTKEPVRTTITSSKKPIKLRNETTANIKTTKSKPSKPVVVTKAWAKKEATRLKNLTKTKDDTTNNILRNRRTDSTVQSVKPTTKKVTTVKKPQKIDSKKKVWDNKTILSKPKRMSNYKQSNLNSLIKQAKDTWKMPLSEDIAKWFIKKPSLLQRKAELDKIKAILKKEANIKDFVKAPKIIKKPVIKKDPNVLDNLNPTWWLFVDYNPSKIAKMKLAKNITTLDKTAWKSPNDIVTIYRWTLKSQKDIVPWDFITTNRDLAKSYAGEWKVITKKVKYSNILDDLKEPLGEEYIYLPTKK